MFYMHASLFDINVYYMPMDDNNEKNKNLVLSRTTTYINYTGFLPLSPPYIQSYFNTKFDFNCQTSYIMSSFNSQSRVVRLHWFCQYQNSASIKTSKSHPSLQYYHSNNPNHYHILNIKSWVLISILCFQLLTNIQRNPGSHDFFPFIVFH